MIRSAWEGLKEQCNKMLDLSPDSYVFLYSRKSISVVPAVSVVGADKWIPHDLSSRSITRFYEEHFQCFIGDR